MEGRLGMIHRHHPRSSILNPRSSILNPSNIHPRSSESSREILNHQEAVIPACVIARHPTHDSVPEIQIESLCDYIRGPHLKPNGRDSASKKPLFNLEHQSATMSVTT